MLLPMTKVQIIGTKDKLEPTLRTLQRLGTVQIEDITERGAGVVLPRMALDEAALARREEIGLLVTRIEALLALFSSQGPRQSPPQPYEEASSRPVEELIAQAKRLLEEVGPQAQQLALRGDELEAERTSLPRYAATLHKVSPLAAELPELAGYETALLLIERRFSPVLDLLRQELPSLIGEEFELHAHEADEETTAAILVFPKQKRAEVDSLLGRQNISQVRLPKELAGVPFKDVLATLAARLAAIPGELETIRRRLQELSLQYSQRLALLGAVLRDRLQELEVTVRLGATQYTFVLLGWVARRNLGKLKEALGERVGEQVIVNELKLDREEMKQAPVALSNPLPFRPFEFLVQLLALPRYGALDPTPLLALFMPIFFGLILGDVAYGVILLIIAGLLLCRLKPGALRNLAQVMIHCGLWAVIFGFLFGEFLGTLGQRAFGLRPLWMERGGQTLIAILVLAVGIGVAHVTLGLLLGIWEAAQRRSGKELSERLGKLVALVAIFWLLGIVSQQLPRELSTPGVVFLIIGIVLLSTPLGWVGALLGPIEALGVLGHVLSYLRLAAIGLASVYLAEVANRLYGMSANVVVGVLIAGLLHALNLTLGIVSSTIQSLRLHYVEFFTKFYESGGKRFQPFKQSGAG